jgi:hypothetical protein
MNGVRSLTSARPMVPRFAVATDAAKRVLRSALAPALAATSWRTWTVKSQSDYRRAAR